MARSGRWPDVSFGPWHQAVPFAAAYGLGNGTPTPSNIQDVRQVLTTDYQRAADIAAQQLAQYYRQYGDPIEAMARYNWPNVPSSQNPNTRHIQDAWARSAAYLAPPPVEPAPAMPAMPSLIGEPLLSRPRPTRSSASCEGTNERLPRRAPAR